MPKIPTETQEQIWLMKWSRQPSIRSQFPDLKYLFHVPNERPDKAQSIILEQMGVKRGVPDLVLPVARGKYHGLYIEMKRTRDGVVSDDQRWWLEELEKTGHAAKVCYGWKQASEVLMWYLSLKEPA